MRTLLDSSEIKEAASLFNDLLGFTTQSTTAPEIVETSVKPGPQPVPISPTAPTVEITSKTFPEEQPGEPLVKSEPEKSEPGIKIEPGSEKKEEEPAPEPHPQPTATIDDTVEVIPKPVPQPQITHEPAPVPETQEIPKPEIIEQPEPAPVPVSTPEVEMEIITEQEEEPQIEPETEPETNPETKPQAEAVTEPKPTLISYRSRRLQDTLISMCTRGGFTGALLADGNGLPLSIHNAPFQEDLLAAFTAVMEEFLEKTERLLPQPIADTISVNFEETDKLILRKFLIKGTPYFLLIKCPRETDERNEMKLSITRLSMILKDRSTSPRPEAQSTPVYTI